MMCWCISVHVLMVLAEQWAIQTVLSSVNFLVRRPFLCGHPCIISNKSACVRDCLMSCFHLQSVKLFSARNEVPIYLSSIKYSLCKLL